MNRVIVTAAAAALMLAAAAPATAGGPPPRPSTHSLSIVATPNPVLLGSPVTVRGNLVGPRNVGERVTLRHDPWPFQSFSNLTNVLTGAAGAYAFANLRPGLNTLYRTRSGQVNSPQVLVTVRPRLSLSVSDSTPTRGQLVRFSGVTTPSHNGRLVLIQRLGSDGVWRTSFRATLVFRSAATSRYSMSRRIFSDGRYRAKLSAHFDHATAYSSSRFLNVP
jgi:hypothetical protein